AFAELVARIMPFDLVIDEETADGREARVSRGSVCGSWGAIAGTLRYFADRFGVPRASIEGTQLPERALGRYARRGEPTGTFAGETPHPDQGRVRRALERFGFYWRRSGGQLTEAGTEPLTARLAQQLAAVASWDDFINTRLTLDVEEVVPAEVRHQLDALPASIHLYGDRVPLDYEVEQGRGVIRLRLREGQARRLQPRDVPALDRPVRFTVLRGKR